MIANIIKENENIIGINIDTEQFYSQSYNENSFIVLLEDNTLLSYIIEILSPTNINLKFENYTDTNSIKMDSKLFLESGEEFNFSNTFIIHETITKPELPTDPNVHVNPPVDPPANPTSGYLTGNTSITDDTGIKKIIIKCNNNSVILFHQNLNPDISFITVKKFSLENFDDFCEDETNLILANNKSEFEFEKDFVYSIIVENENLTFSENYINGKPSVYFSSVKNIMRLSDKFSIKISELKDNFDLKLKIWQESKNALSYAGVNQVDVKNNDIGLLNKYVTYKIFAFLLAKNLIDLSYVPDTEKQESISSLKLDVLEITNNKDINVFEKINKVISELRQEIEDIEYVIRKNFSLVFPTIKR